MPVIKHDSKDRAVVFISDSEQVSFDARTWITSALRYETLKSADARDELLIQHVLLNADSYAHIPVHESDSDYYALRSLGIVETFEEGPDEVALQNRVDGGCLHVVDCELDLSPWLDDVLYLVRLYLCACGVEKHRGIVEGARRSKLHPKFLMFSIPEGLSADMNQVGGSTRRYEYIYRDHAFCVMWYTSTPEWRTMASDLLVMLANSVSKPRYTNDGGRFQHVQHTGIYDELFRMMEEGKIIACPYCGEPVVRERSNGKPFCKKSHQTRYSEKARLVLDGGASAVEVHEQFPHIGLATIEGWQQ